MGKRGAISLSFGMIFSVIMIIGIIAVGFYAINFFLNMQNCSNIGLFKDEFQGKINKARASEIASERISLRIPNQIKLVCFGNLENPGSLSGRTEQAHSELKMFISVSQRENSNMFLYPASQACKMGYSEVNHLDITELGNGQFSCIENEDGEVTFKLKKESGDAFVKIYS